MCRPCGPSRVLANKESGGAGQQLRGRAPAPRAKPAREWKRGQAGNRGALCAQLQHSDFGLGGSENLLAAGDLVVDRLGGGGDGVGRTLVQQGVREVELVV